MDDITATVIPTEEPEEIQDDIVETVSPTPEVYYTDAESFENTGMYVDQYQYRTLNNQKIMVSLLYVLAIEVLVVIFLICRRRK